MSESKNFDNGDQFLCVSAICLENLKVTKGMKHLLCFTLKQRANYFSGLLMVAAKALNSIFLLFQTKKNTFAL